MPLILLIAISPNIGYKRIFIEKYIIFLSINNEWVAVDL